MAPTHPQRVLRLIEQAGIIRPRDLERWGIPRAILQRLVRRGDVERVGRGLYMLPPTSTWIGILALATSTGRPISVWRAGTRR
jgi:predicted transcriptional regulator of viral defense system